MKNKICLFFMIFFMVLIFVGCKMDVNSTTNDNQSTSENQKPTTDTDISESVPSNSESNYFSLFGTDADPYKEWRNMEDGTILGISYGGNYVRTDVLVGNGDTYEKSTPPFYFEGGNPENRDYRFANSQIGINDFYRKTITENRLGNMSRYFCCYLDCVLSDGPTSLRVISQNLGNNQYTMDLAEEIIEKFRANPDAEPTPIYKAKLNEAGDDVEWVDGVVEGTPVLTNELVASVTGFKEDIQPCAVASEMWNNVWTYTAEFEVRDERVGYEGKTYYVYIGYTYAPDGYFKESAGKLVGCQANIQLDAEQKFKISCWQTSNLGKRANYEIKLSKDFPASRDAFEEMCKLEDYNDDRAAGAAISIVWRWLVDVNDGSQKQTTYTYTVDGVEYTKKENNWDRLVRVYNFYHQNDPIL